MNEFIKISIHSLRMEGDPTLDSFSNHLSEFQSTPSAWRETSFSDFNNFRFFISIHSLRMEGDPISIKPSFFVPVISIHSLRMEGDPLDHPESLVINGFQSTPSAWRETVNTIAKIAEWGVFQSTPSAWRETQ